MTHSKHVVVCGGGIVGLCCAHALVREGHRVTLLERDAEDHDTCAGGSAGYVSASHGIPLAAAGMVAHGLERLANELGVEARVLDAREAAAVEPGAKLDIVGAVYFPPDAHLTPRRFTAVVTRLLREAGVTFRFNTAVTGWRLAGNRVAA